MTEIADISTLRVIDWLRFYKKQFIVINELSCVRLVEYKYEIGNFDFTLNIDGETLSYSDISGYWHRRAGINPSTFLEKSQESDLHFVKLLNKFLQAEEAVILMSIYEKLPKLKNSIGNYTNSDVSKLKQLDMAASVGLNIPKTLITCTRERVMAFFKKTDIITKSIHFSVDINVDSHRYTLLTEKIRKQDLPARFQYTLFQENIQKKIELRIFYLKGKIFTMAICSQNAKETITDYRNYNYEMRTRVFPFTLPSMISKRIVNLMQHLNLTSGSLDMILSTDNKYYFLEINPVGQFGIVSSACNYNLEKLIAENLINEDKIKY